MQRVHFLQGGKGGSGVGGGVEREWNERRKEGDQMETLKCVIKSGAL